MKEQEDSNQESNLKKIINDIEEKAKSIEIALMENPINIARIRDIVSSIYKFSYPQSTIPPHVLALIDRANIFIDKTIQADIIEQDEQIRTLSEKEIDDLFKNIFKEDYPRFNHVKEEVRKIEEEESRIQREHPEFAEVPQILGRLRNGQEVTSDKHEILKNYDQSYALDKLQQKIKYKQEYENYLNKLLNHPEQNEALKQHVNSVFVKNKKELEHFKAIKKNKEEFLKYKQSQNVNSPSLAIRNALENSQDNQQLPSDNYISNVAPQRRNVNH